MQLKTANKIVRKKMNEWLSSIKDERLREEVRQQLLVSGGAIASLLTKEPINDFDVYIMDIDVLKKLCEYYCKDKGIAIYDGRDRKKYIDDFRKDRGQNPEQFNQDRSLDAVTIRTLKEDQIKISAMGGGIRVDDVDEGSYKPTFYSPNAISLEGDVQIVCRFSGSPEEIHKNYDFVHATNFFTMDEGIVTNNEALISLLTKQLRYQGSLYPITSIIRIKKFTGRGYSINAGEILKILWQVAKLDLEDIDVLHEQLVGVDVAYFSTLIKILSNSNEDQIMSEGYIFSIIDKVFGDDYVSE